MIFLCGNCQAKYQLPDERVAGRTVRMKCRKCAHLIEVTGPAPEASATAEPQGWYAGIDGTPTGPLSEDELASKLGAGVMTGETLVWREGLDGWKPLAEIAELATLVAAAPAPPAPEPASVEPAPVEPARPQPSPPVISRPSAPPSRPSPPRAVPSARTSLAGAAAVAGKLEEEPSSMTSTPEPAPPVASLAEPSTEEAAPSMPHPGASLPERPAPSEAPPSTAEALEATARESLFNAEPASLAAPLGGPSSAPPPPQVDPVVPIAAPRPRVHPAAWALVGFGGVLVGVVAGLSFAKGSAEAPTEPVAAAPSAQEAPVASAAPPSTEAPEPATAEAALSESEEPAEPVAAPEAAPSVRKAATTRPAEPSKARQAAAPQATAPATAPTMGGLSNLSGLGAGPTPGPSKTSSAGGGGALSQADVERVVHSHRAFVNRRCWELALATKTQGAPSSARVATTITIAPNGNVTSASATGGDGYPGLASCVAGQVRGWKFPSSEGGTVNIPFVFAAQ